MEEKNFKKYFFWASLLIIAMLSYFIIKDFLIAILSAFVLAYLLMPVQKFFKKIMPERISALLIIIIIILLVVVPVYFLTKSLINQIASVATIENLEKAYAFLKGIEIPKEILEYLPEDITGKISSYLFSLIASVIKYIPFFILSIIVTLFVAYYFLLEWDKLNKEIRDILPFKNKDKIIKEFSDTANNIVFGNLLIAIIEFIIAMIGFYFIGIKYSIILSFLIALSALIPLIGPAFIWVPVLIIEILQKSYLSAFLILILGAMLSFGVDFFLRTAIIGKEAKIHPVIVLIGVLGGGSIFGIFGFIIGPLILGFFINFIKAAMENKK